MKKFKYVLTSLFMLGVSVGASAYDFSSQTRYADDEALDSVWLYYSINPDGATVSVTQGPANYNFDSVEIPETVTHDGKTYTVTEIAYQAFVGGNINIVKMANTITEIGDYAFKGSSLNKILFSKNLKLIGDCAFCRTQLSSIDLPEGIEIIGESAFAGDTDYIGNPLGKIRFVTLPSTLKSIGAYAFKNNAYLNDVVIPDNIISIKERTFSNCIDLDKITLSNKLQSIGDYAFYGCAFTEIKGGVETASLKNVSIMPIESTSLIIPPSLTTIGNNAFSNNELLKSVVLPNNILRIGTNCFSSNAYLESITFSSGMTELPNSVCDNCPRLVDVKIPNSITKIGERAFAGNNLLSHIELPATITEIGSSAFSGAGLVDISLPPLVEEIKSNTFQNCTYLVNVNIPDSIKIIGSGAFRDCEGLETVEVPDGVTTLSSLLFYGCKSLTSVTLPKTLKTIEDNVFNGCSALEAIELPMSLESLGGSAFSGCPSLKNITLYHNVKTIGSRCFYGCTSLESVHYKRAIPSIVSNVIQTDNTCTLYVPTGSKATFESTSGWSAFSAIVEEEIGYDILYRVSASKSGQGTIAINGENKNYSDILSGSKVGVTFNPASGWALKAVSLNDKDVTAELNDNEYMIDSLGANMVFAAVFEELPVILCLRSATGGTIDIPVVKGNNFTCKFTPDEGWLINNVRYNNSDVTSSLTENNEYTTPVIKANAMLTVSYETDNNSVENIAADSEMKAYVIADGMLVVEGAADGYPIAVYDVDGRVLTSLISVDGKCSYQLPDNGVYIVKGISKSIKVGF